MKSVAVYEKTKFGFLRVGEFTASGTSIRRITQEYLLRHPRVDPATLYFAPRVKLFGEWQDGEKIPAEPSP